jgi:4-amino-4-deoxy-L-arabinose transferase-like glycosyltransferase
MDMFSDGIWYASAARNMAEGVGSFWHPHYMDGIDDNFMLHFPLGIWMQSLAFRIFGDSTLVEFFWGASAGLMIVLLICVLWRRLGGIKSDLPGAWWPAVLFALTPMVSWVVANNLLESTMTVFVMLGAIAAYQAVVVKGRWRILLWISLSGGFLSLALLTKGLPGVFPLALPLLAGYFLDDVPRRRGIATTAAVLYCFLCLSSEMRP